MTDQAERAELVARTAFAAEWEQLAHTTRVVAELVEAGCDSDTVAAGWLHDVVEDSAVDYVDLVDMGFPSVVVEAVELLTREDVAAKGDSVRLEYEIYKTSLLTARGAAGDIARRVKLADARDNLRRCEDSPNVPKWARLADTRYRPMVEELERRMS